MATVKTITVKWESCRYNRLALFYTVWVLQRKLWQFWRIWQFSRDTRTSNDNSQSSVTHWNHLWFYSSMDVTYVKYSVINPQNHITENSQNREQLKLTTGSLRWTGFRQLSHKAVTIQYHEALKYQTRQGTIYCFQVTVVTLLTVVLSQKVTSFVRFWF